MRPGICDRSGIRLPNGATSGSRIPLRTGILGHGFQRVMGCELHEVVIKTLVKGVGNKWRFQQFVLMWGGGTIILVSQKNDPSMGKLRRGLVTDIG